jgi:hypothetical protein
MQAFGRTLQIAGLVILPLSIMLELSGSLARSFGLNEMLIMLVFGACVFYLGRYLEGYGS